jgi:hypothetical protein
MEHQWNETDRGKPKYSGEKPVPVPLCPPQIPHGLTRKGVSVILKTTKCNTTVILIIILIWCKTKKAAADTGRI